MRRAIVALTLLLAMSCRYPAAAKRAAVTVVMTSIVRMQSHAPLTQSSVRPAAAPGPDRRLVACTAKKPRTV